MSDPDLDDLRDELSEFAAPEKKGGRSAQEERVIAGFEDIQRFVETHARAPLHGEGRDIFERLYAVRLDRLRALPDCRAILAPLDHQGLLTGTASLSAAPADTMDDDELLAELTGAAGITTLRHVRTSAEKRATEDIADRQVCADFARFKPLFEQVQRELASGVRATKRFGTDTGYQKAEVKAGQFFILGGQTAYVAEVGTLRKTPNGEQNGRLRVIFSNGTESDLLLRSLQRALYKDDAGRRISEPVAGPLFGDRLDDGDTESGTIYVLRSLSDHPYVDEHRALIHKIGVTGGKVETRIANAAHEATYLLAEVEVIATYKLTNINRAKLEAIFHRIFAPAQLDLTIADRFGHKVRPREWFLVPLHVIDEAVGFVRDGSIAGMVYDPKMAQLVREG